MVSPDDQTASPKTFLSVEDITIRAKNRLCFAGTHWQMRDGEQWAIIGPTGGGKSIFVKALAGRLPVVRGQILNYFDGTPEGRAYSLPGEVILVSAETQRDMLQRHAQYHQARWQSTEGGDVPTVTEFLRGELADDRLSYDANPADLDEAALSARKLQAVDLLGISHLMERRVTHLSNGEGRRVLLARALTLSPKLLILDDPFAGLDHDTRRTLIGSLTTLLESRRQRLLLVVSREEEIPQGITHVMGIADHQIVVQGTKTEVCASLFARKVFEAETAPAEEDLTFPTEDWPALPAGTPLIEFDHVSVTYQGADVLRDITWTMRKGEHWAIRGPNGAGKSTLLSLILADNPQAYANEVKIFGQQRGSGESIWEIKQHIGWVAPEIHMYYPARADCRMVVCSGFFDSVGLYRQPTEEQSQTAADWMRVLRIDGLAERPFNEISVGEQRLVLLARALVKQPRLLILDEPCQGLDSAHRARILRVLDALCEQTPVSLLYVTHHRDEVPRVITNVLRLERGRVREIE